MGKTGVKEFWWSVTKNKLVVEEDGVERDPRPDDLAELEQVTRPKITFVRRAEFFLEEWRWRLWGAYECLKGNYLHPHDNRP